MTDTTNVTNITNVTDSVDAGLLFDQCVETAKVLILGTSNGHLVLPNLSEAMQVRILAVARANYEYLTGTKKAEPENDSDTLDKVRRAIKSTYSCSDETCKCCAADVEDLISAMQESGIVFRVQPVMRGLELINVIYDEASGPFWKALTTINESASGPDATAAEWAAAHPSMPTEPDESKDDPAVYEKTRQVFIERMVSHVPELNGAMIDRIFETVANDNEINMCLVVKE